MPTTPASNICIDVPVSCITKYANAPQEAHMTALKNILHYLEGTLDSAMFYPYGDDQPFDIFADSNYRGCTDTRRSTS